MSTQQASTLSVLATLAALQQWEHWETIRLVAKKEYNISQEDFRYLLPEYQKFLALLVEGQSLSMCSAQVDKLWHSHILCTQLYETFCLRYFKRMIHHVPNLETMKEQCICKPSCETPSPNCDECAPPPDEGQPSTDRIALFVRRYIFAYGSLPTPVWNCLLPDAVATPCTEG